MLRSGLRSNASYSGFLSDDLSTDDMQLQAASPKRPSPPKKTKRKKNSKKASIFVEQQSAEEQQQPEQEKIVKKKKSKKSKRKNSPAGDVEQTASERKIVQGRRRIQRQDNVESLTPKVKSPSPIQSRKASLRSSPLKALQDSQGIIEVNLEATQRKSLRNSSTSPLKVSKRLENKNKENVVDEEYHTAEEKSSPVKSPAKSRSIIELREDENKIVTSMQKYTESHDKKVNLFDEPYNLSYEEEHVQLRPRSKRGTFDISGIELNQSVTKKRTTFEKSPRKESQKRNTFEVEAESPVKLTQTKSKKRDTFEVANKEESPVKGSNQTSNKKRTTFEVPCEVLEPNAKRRITDNKESPVKVMKRKSIEIQQQEVERSERRRTFDLNVNGISTKSPEKAQKNRRTGVQDETVIIDLTPSRNTRRSSRRESLKQEVKKPTTVATRKSLSTMHKKKLEKIRITESKSSLSESGLSSPTVLFRRALRMNPPSARTSTPKAPPYKATISPKIKKTPQVSVSKVRKVPNYTAIHQNAYNKMESVDVHLERKATRAQALLSGQKVPACAKITPLDGRSKKQLNFSPALTDAKISFNFSNKTTNSPVAFNARKQLGAGDATVVLEAQPLRKTRNAMKTVGFNVATPTRGRSDSVRLAKTPRPTKAEIWNAYGTKIPRPAAPLFTTGATASTGDVHALPRVQLRSTAKNASRRLEAVSVSSKSKASSTTVDYRRDHIKGVRSNRRFDLLMSMRK